MSEILSSVAVRLDRLRRSIRRLFAIDGAARVLMALTAFVLASFALDWALILPAPVRLVILAGGLGSLGWLLWRRLLYPLSVRISDDDLAIFVERHYPELNDRLISAIQLGRVPQEASDRSIGLNSPELVEALVADAGQATADLDFRSVVVGRHVKRLAGVSAFAFLLLLLGGLWNPNGYASIYLNRVLGGATKWPQRTHLRVLDFANNERVIAKGEDLAIAVEYRGVEPSRVVLEYEFDTKERGREHMGPVKGPHGKLFHYSFPRVTGNFTFTVTGGDDTTEKHTVRTVNPPSIESVSVYFEYPAYLHKANTPPDRPEASGNVVAPFYTKVRFEALANEDLKGATLALGIKGKETQSDMKIEASPAGKPRRVTGVFEVTESYSEYVIQLQALNGLSNRDPLRYTIKGIEDRIPEILVKDPLSDELVSELCERPLEVEVRDDYGIARIALQFKALSKEKGTDWTTVDFTRAQNNRDYGETAIRSEYTLDISKLGLQVGDHVELRFRAEDFKNVGDPHIVYSKVYRLSLVSIGTLEKELQDKIEAIKQMLKLQKSRQEALWNRSIKLVEKFGKQDLLSVEQQGEVRQAGHDQNEITGRLDGARRDIRQVQRRGVYNKIYDATAAAKLQGAIEELDLLVGSLDDASKPGTSPIAAASIDQAARVKTASERTTTLRDGQNWQNAVAVGIQKAIDYLEKWSSYQEVIRITRELMEAQNRVVGGIKKLGGGK